MSILLRASLQMDKIMPRTKNFSKRGYMKIRRWRSSYRWIWKVNRKIGRKQRNTFEIKLDFSHKNKKIVTLPICLENLKSILLTNLWDKEKVSLKIMYIYYKMSMNTLVVTACGITYSLKGQKGWLKIHILRVKYKRLEISITN